MNKIIQKHEEYINAAHDPESENDVRKYLEKKYK